jgi:hypothetical protein
MLGSGASFLTASWTPLLGGWVVGNKADTVEYQRAKTLLTVALVCRVAFCCPPPSPRMSSVPLVRYRFLSTSNLGPGLNIYHPLAGRMKTAGGHPPLADDLNPRRDKEHT